MVVARQPDDDGGDITVSLVGTDRGFDEAMAAIEHFGGRALLD